MQFSHVMGGALVGARPCRQCAAAIEKLARETIARIERDREEGAAAAWQVDARGAEQLIAARGTTPLAWASVVALVLSGGEPAGGWRATSTIQGVLYEPRRGGQS